jgi:hypothetical protein
VVNADNAHKDAFVEKACDRSVVAHAIAPAAMKSSGPGLIETPWICVAGNVRNEITRAAPVRLAVEALEFAQGLPQGRAADVQLLAEILFDKPRARLQGSRLHRHAQAGGNLSAQGRSFVNKGSKARFGNI